MCALDGHLLWSSIVLTYTFSVVALICNTTHTIITLIISQIDTRWETLIRVNGWTAERKKILFIIRFAFSFWRTVKIRKKMVIRTSQLVINKFVTSPNCWSYIRYTDMYDVRGSVKAKTIDSIDEQCIVSKCTFNAHWQDMHSEIAVVCCRLIISTE